jgi:hypothetical protein
LHIKAIYGYIHKHHHQQKAPRYVATFTAYCIPYIGLCRPFFLIWIFFSLQSRQH